MIPFSCISDEELTTSLVERFLSYVSISSQSDGHTETVPSTDGQWTLAKLLYDELQSLGLIDVHLSAYGIVTAKLPGNTEADPIGWVAHMDTVDVNLSPHIRPQIIHYMGGDVLLNEAQHIVMKADEHPELAPYVGQAILFTDGTSVLGADNKAAIATIMTALSYWVAHPAEPRGDIYVAFVPDEEIGLVGAKHLEFTRFCPKYAYTIDCCGIGEVVYETFNAGYAHINITGVSAHPMSAKGVLVNPSLIAVDIVNAFNRLETPENTDGTDGYIWVQDIRTNQTNDKVTLNIRDHHREKYEAKKAYIEHAVRLMQERYPRAKITLDMDDVYGNIKDSITDADQRCIDYIYDAMEALSITPITIAMRGGTDGSYISTQGIPTPNFFTGAHNFHSPYEFLPLPSFVKSCRMVQTIANRFATDSAISNKSI